MQATSIPRHRFTHGAIGLTLSVLVTLLLIAVPPLALASPPAQSAEQGQSLFEQKCASCHTVGGGRAVGSDLQGVTERRDRDWLVRVIVAPDQLLAQQDPIATQLFSPIAMPNMGVSEAEAASILAYLETQAATPAATPAAQAPTAAEPKPAPRGDPVAGQALFAGTTRFENGGAACLACHSAAGTGALGGGTLGPDLTQAHGKFGDVALTSLLAGLPFPTMKPIYDQAPLTPGEQADVQAFLQTAAALQPVSATWQVALLSLAIFALAMLLAHVVWRQRLRGVRRPLVAASSKNRREAA